MICAPHGTVAQGAGVQVAVSGATRGLQRQTLSVAALQFRFSIAEECCVRAELRVLVTAIATVVLVVADVVKWDAVSV